MSRRDTIGFDPSVVDRSPQDLCVSQLGGSFWRLRPDVTSPAGWRGAKGCARNRRNGDATGCPDSVSLTFKTDVNFPVVNLFYYHIKRWILRSFSIIEPLRLALGELVGYGFFLANLVQWCSMILWGEHMLMRIFHMSQSSPVGKTGDFPEVARYLGWSCE